MDDRCIIRQATTADAARIARAWQEAYGAMTRFKYPDRWQWNLLGNPYVAAERRPLLWFASVGDEIAAWTSAFVVPIEAAGARLLGAHSVDTFTLPRFRQHGFGQLLQEENRKAHPLFIAINPSPANRRNKYRVGGRPGKPLYTYQLRRASLDAGLLYDSALELVEKYFGGCGRRFFAGLRRCGAEALLGFAINAGFYVRGWFLGRGPQVTPAAVTLREVEHFGAEADQLWMAVAPRYSLSVRRDAEYLNWKYVQHPHLRYRKLFAWRGEQPVGALIYRYPLEPVEQRAGIIAECFCLDDEPAIYAALLAAVEADGARQRLPLINCGASSAPLQRVLRSRGYQPIDIDVPVVHLAVEVGFDFDALLAKEWLLSLGDSDLDQVSRSHQPTFVEVLRLFFGRVPGAENLP